MRKQTPRNRHQRRKVGAIALVFTLGFASSSLARPRANIGWWLGKIYACKGS